MTTDSISSTLTETGEEAKATSKNKNIIVELTIEEAKSLFETFEASVKFNGFDPTKMFAEICGRIANAIRKPDWPIPDSSIKLEFAFLSAIIHLRGTNFEKINGTMQGDCNARLAKLIDVLNIKVSKNSRRNLKPDTITANRIAAILAPVIFRFAILRPSTLVASLNDINGAVKTNCFSAVCPTDSKFDKCARINLYFIKKFGEITIKKAEDRPNNEKIISYFRAANNSTFITQTQRQTIFMKTNFEEIKKSLDDWYDAHEGMIGFSEFHLVE